MIERYLDCALAMAKAAEAVIMPHYRSTRVSLKADGTEVTDADREAEEIIRRTIASRFPGHAVLGEEFGTTGGDDATHRWIVDPIDGTAAFVLGVPTFGTLIALLEEGDPVVGVIHMPAMGETVYAAKGHGCWLRVGDSAPVRAHVGAVKRVNDAVASATGVHGSDIVDGATRSSRLTRLIRSVRKFRFVGDCLQHALVCRGRLDVAVDTAMQPWDIAAIIPCIRESGGVASTLSGRRDDLTFGDSLVTSCSEELHREVLELLRSDAGTE